MSNMISIKPGFDMEAMITKLVSMYQSKGYSVVANFFSENAMVTFEKNGDGIKKFVGLTEGIKANFSINNNALIINFTEAEWNSKIIGFVVGFFLCWIPWIPAIIGTCKQTQLPKNIANDVQMLV